MLLALERIFNDVTINVKKDDQDQCADTSLHVDSHDTISFVSH
jgi:hypothetical protein